MKKLFVLFVLFFVSSSLYAQKDAYQLYNEKGKKVNYKKMLKEANKADVLLFGELHNDPIAHWLQLELTKDLNKTQSLVLGFEMLEADNQQQVNDYLSNTIDAKALDTLARLWPNYKTDYAPIVDFAKENNLTVVATNIPRRYARIVHRKGFEALDSLPKNEKEWIAPLPIQFEPELPNYKKILTMMGDHASPKMVMAQAIKDATMAHFILSNWQKGELFVHFNGSWHSDDKEGIAWYISQANEEINQVSITTVLQKDVDDLEEEHIGSADFILVVDEDMTRTY